MIDDIYRLAQVVLLSCIKRDSYKDDRDILLVDKFLNQELNTHLISLIGEGIAKKYRDAKITKVMTIESSGIPIAFATAKELGVNALFAKKSIPINSGKDVLKCEVYSYTKQQTYPLTVSKDLIKENDRILVVDDFLARGEAMSSMIQLVKSANATVVAAIAAIGKPHQGGIDLIRSQGICTNCLIELDENLNASAVEFKF